MILFLVNKWPASDGWSVIGKYIVEGLGSVQNTQRIILGSGSIVTDVYPNIRLKSCSKVGNVNRGWILPYFYSSLIDIIKNLRTLRRISKVVCVSENTWFLARLIRFISGADIYGIVHGTYGVRYLNSSLIHFRGELIFVSEYSRLKVEEVLKKRSYKYHIIPNGIDLSLFVQRSCKRNSNSVIFVGNSKFRKGLDLVLDSFEKLTHIGIFFTVVGKLHQEHIDRIQSMEHVTFNHLSRVTTEELAHNYSLHKVNVLPSREDSNGAFEGFGLIHLEALACGTPSIGTKHSGNSEIRVKGMYHLESNDEVSELASLLSHIFELDEVAVGDVFPYFSKERMVEDYARILNVSF